MFEDRGELPDTWLQGLLLETEESLAGIFYLVARNEDMRDRLVKDLASLPYKVIIGSALWFLVCCDHLGVVVESDELV